MLLNTIPPVSAVPIGGCKVERLLAFFVAYLYVISFRFFHCFLLNSLRIRRHDYHFRRTRLVIAGYFCSLPTPGFMFLDFGLCHLGLVMNLFQVFRLTFASGYLGLVFRKNIGLHTWVLSSLSSNCHCYVHHLLFLCDL